MAETEAQWYILHTYSGYEVKVAEDLMKVVKNSNLRHLIEEVFVPGELITDENGEVVKIKDKEKDKEKGDKESKEKLFPCYVFVKMIVTNESWYICRNTRGVTGFVGPGSQPIPLSEDEVKNLGIISKEPTVSFAVGDMVCIKSGLLEGFEGTIKELDLDNNSVLVDVYMMGRITPAPLDISTIRKI